MFGLSSDWLIHADRVIPSVLVLSHAEQLERLRQDCPEAVERAVLAGDLVFDRLVASTSLRASYRRAFALPAERYLIVMSSTWGTDSLLGQHPELPARVAKEVPADEFAVVLTVHPNIWFGRSRWEVRSWLSAARHAGVHVLEDVDEWQAALVAADLTIGDHGSVSFYSAGLGTPLLLASAPTHAVAADSPIAALLRAATTLDVSGDLEGQVRTAVLDADPDRLKSITDLTTSHAGLAAATLRSVLYRVLDMDEPGLPAEIDTVPLPSRALDAADAHVVWVELTGRRSATMIRRPAERLRDAPWGSSRGHHVAIGVTGTRARWLALADVVVGTAGPDTTAWITNTLGHLPGCLLATAPDGKVWLLGDRRGSVLTVLGPGAGPRLFASVAHQWLVDERALDDIVGEWLITAGRREYRVMVNLSTADVRAWR